MYKRANPKSLMNYKMRKNGICKDLRRPLRRHGEGYSQKNETINLVTANENRLTYALTADI